MKRVVRIGDGGCRLYKTASDAAADIGVTRIHLSRVLRDGRFKRSGYEWFYPEEY